MSELNNTKKVEDKMSRFEVPQALLTVLVLLALTVSINAAVPGVINYQGRLTDSLDVPVDNGNYQMTFKIYGSESGTDVLWNSGSVSILVVNGLFNVQLGSTPMSALPDDLFSESTARYLGITVGTNPELIPRTQITSAAYAFHSLRADTASFAQNVIGGDGWVDDGSVVRLSSASDKVGIGVIDPPYKLTINGEIAIANGGETKYHINYYQDGFNIAETGVQDRRIHISDGGNVGIGTANPGAKLGVAGDLKVTGAYHGTISSSSGSDGAPFPRPAYDSGWRSISAGESLTLTHNIGGDVSDYVVDLQLRDQYGQLHTEGFGYYVDISDRWQGVAYRQLTASSITVMRGDDDIHTDDVRVRIWVVE
jgi:hypothetical protein